MNCLQAILQYLTLTLHYTSFYQMYLQFTVHANFIAMAGNL